MKGDDRRAVLWTLGTLLASLVLVTCWIPAAAQPQIVARISYDYPVTTGPGAPTAATVTFWTATVYVNGLSFALTDNCILTPSPGSVITCTADLPTIASALTPTGTQTIEVSFREGVLEGPKSAPLVSARPGAPTNLRIQ